MARRSRGTRSKTRQTLRIRGRHRTTVNKRLETYKEGERVAIKIDPATQDGMPHPRHNGKNGIVLGMRGRSYLIGIKDGKADKTLIALPEHLKHFKS